MRLRLLASLVLIVAVAAMSVAGTLAYFSGSKDGGVEVETASIGIGDTSQFPLKFTGLLPGDTKVEHVWVKNGGTAKADFYVQLISTPDSTPDSTNFCSPEDVLDLQIIETDGSWVPTRTWYNGSICNLFPGWSGSTIAKVADDVDPDAAKYYELRLTLDPKAGNGYQGKSNSDTVHLIAIQYNGPAPVPDKQGGTVQYAWPDDATDQDDDPNYP